MVPAERAIPHRKRYWMDGIVGSLIGGLCLLSGIWDLHQYSTSRVPSERPVVSYRATSSIPMPPPPATVQRILLQRFAFQNVPVPTDGTLPYAWLIDRYARRHNLDWRLIAALIEVESGFNPWAISPRGAIGLMQVIPETAILYGATDLFNPRDNIRVGVAYLRYLIDTYHGDIEQALAAYNAGPGPVTRYGGLPPYRETRLYVRRVLAAYDRWLKRTLAVP